MKKAAASVCLFSLVGSSLTGCPVCADNSSERSDNTNRIYKVFLEVITGDTKNEADAIFKRCVQFFPSIEKYGFDFNEFVTETDNFYESVVPRDLGAEGFIVDSMLRTDFVIKRARFLKNFKCAFNRWKRNKYIERAYWCSGVVAVVSAVAYYVWGWFLKERNSQEKPQLGKERKSQEKSQLGKERKFQEKSRSYRM